MRTSLRQQAINAPKYVLYNETLGFLADDQTMTSLNFTPEKELARQFSIGFDDPNQKLGIWNAMGKIKLGSSNIFEAVELCAF